jgi:ABC-type polysaccharide/polyol phosphate export permease
MYITPVLYARSALPGGLDLLVSLNPATAPVEMVKFGLIDAGDVEGGALVSTFVFLAVVGGSGLWFFARMAPGILRAQPHLLDDEAEE